jgi:hypothetical protein
MVHALTRSRRVPLIPCSCLVSWSVATGLPTAQVALAPPRLQLALQLRTLKPSCNSATCSWSAVSIDCSPARQCARALALVAHIQGPAQALLCLAPRARAAAGEWRQRGRASRLRLPVTARFRANVASLHTTQNQRSVDFGRSAAAVQGAARCSRRAHCPAPAVHVFPCPSSAACDRRRLHLSVVIVFSHSHAGSNALEQLCSWLLPRVYGCSCRVLCLMA